MGGETLLTSTDSRIAPHTLYPRRNDESVNKPYGAGAVRRLLALLPQQAIVPSVLMPQVCSLPALTAV